MARKTKQEKIILQLKRDLARKEAELKKLKGKDSPKKEKKAKAKKPKKQPQKQAKNTDNSIFFYDPGLVKKDLAKSLIFTLAIFALEFVLYLRLK